MGTETDQRELERTLDLLPAPAIGTGTMVGAGIFVFPGLAAGEAGPAAMLSFAIGAVIALLVALPTSKLATAMPVIVVRHEDEAIDAAEKTIEGDSS